MAQWYVLIGHNAHSLALVHDGDTWTQTYWENSTSRMSKLMDMSLKSYWLQRWNDVYEIPASEAREWTQWRGDAETYETLKAKLDQ